MTLIRESCVYSLFLMLASVYEDSALHRILAVLGRWCTRQIDGSAILRPLCREGAVARAGAGRRRWRLLGSLAHTPGGRGPGH